MKKISVCAVAFFIFCTVVSYAQITGMTSQGGANNKGVIYTMNNDGTGYTVVHSFNTSGGYNPVSGKLVKANNGMLYGLNKLGGASNLGTIFKFDQLTNTYTKVFTFNGTNGGNPYGSFLLASNGLLYATTETGGTNNVGTLFSFDVTTNTQTVVFNFSASSGKNPQCTLVQDANGKIFGTTTQGGTDDRGVLFRFNPVNGTYSVLSSNFGTTFNTPHGALLIDKDGLINGVCDNHDQVDPVLTLYTYNIASAIYTPLYSTTDVASIGFTTLTENTNRTAYYYLRAYFTTNNFEYYNYNITSRQVVSGSPVFNYTFTSPEGPGSGGIVKGDGDVFYGGGAGGANGLGIIYKFDISSGSVVFEKLHDFTGGADGSSPYGNLFYGCAVAAPATPGAIVRTGGSDKICNGDQRIYTVPAVAGITYDWIAPDGTTITSGQGTNSIHLSFQSGFANAGDTLKVVATQSCARSAAQKLTIKRKLPAVPADLVQTGGPAKVCIGETRTYTTTGITGLTYIWNVPLGATIVSGQGTNSIQVQFGLFFIYGSQISVSAHNDCGTSNPKKITVNKRVPAVPGPVSGLASVCNGSTHTYSIAAVPQAISYSWSVPPLAAIQGTANGTSVNVTFGLLNGNVSVTASSACATSAASSLPIHISCREADFAVADEAIVTLFPNPANGVVTLQFDSNSEIDFTVTVKDITGRVLMSNQSTSAKGNNLHEINLADFSTGLYIVTFESAGSQKQLKLVKE